MNNTRAGCFFALLFCHHVRVRNSPKSVLVLADGIYTAIIRRKYVRSAAVACPDHPPAKGGLMLFNGRDWNATSRSGAWVAESSPSSMATREILSVIAWNACEPCVCESNEQQSSESRNNNQSNSSSNRRCPIGGISCRRRLRLRSSHP